MNSQIATSILACLRAETFDATGTLDSLWMERLETTTADAEAMIEELLAEDGLEGTSAMTYAAVKDRGGASGQRVTRQSLVTRSPSFIFPLIFRPHSPIFPLLSVCRIASNRRASSASNPRSTGR